MEIDRCISVAAPTCRSNISLTNVLVENDCNLEPDSIEFNCTAAYYGNSPPMMQLQFTSIGVLNDERGDCSQLAAVDHQLHQNPMGRQSKLANKSWKICMRS